MSAQEFMSHLQNTPTAFVLIANGIWSRYEDLEALAVFDTEEMALAYVNASRLPSAIWTIDGHRRMGRSHRPDSILWDYNRREKMVVRADVRFCGLDMLVNPAPPSGPLDAAMFSNLAEEDAATVRGWLT